MKVRPAAVILMWGMGVKVIRQTEGIKNSRAEALWRCPGSLQCAAGRSKPYTLRAASRAVPVNVLQGSAQVPQAIGLPDQVGMQRNTHHERLLVRLQKHLVKLVDDHLGKILAVHLPTHDH